MSGAETTYKPIQSIHTSGLSLFDYGVLTLWLCLGAYFCLGFFSPDEEMIGGYNRGLHSIIIAVLQYGSGIAALGIAFLYILIRRGRIPGILVAGVSFGILASILLAYPLAVELIWGRSSGDLSLSAYHPYLQQAPDPFALRHRDGQGGAYRIVCLGGSTTAWGDKKGRRWTDRVEEQLRVSCPSCEVYNQGHDWYTTLHSLINYSTNIRQYRPQAVLVMHGINDLMHNVDFGHLSNGPFRDDYGHYLGPISRIINKRTPMRTFYQQFRRYWYSPVRTDIDMRTFPGVEAFRRNLNTIADLVAIDGGSLVLMTEANLYRDKPSAEELEKMVMFNFESYGPAHKWTYDSARLGMAVYNDVIRDVARERGAVLVDMDATLPKSLDYFLDDVHFTDLSHPIVAQKVSDALFPILQSNRVAYSKLSPAPL